MPKSSNVLQFSLPNEIRSRLEEMSLEGESVSLVAKRVLLEALGISSPSLPIAGESLNIRLKEIEVTLKEQEHIKKRLDELGEHLQELGIRQVEIERLLSAMPALEDIKNRLEKLEQSPAAVILTKKPDTALSTGLTNPKLAEKLGASRSTVQRWTKDPAKWPTGWRWSPESELWFSTEKSF